VVDVDVVIVGGGPAGCSSALSLVARGCAVAVISSPNRREKPTETSTPRLKQLLHSLGAEEALSACEPCFGVVSDWGKKNSVLQPGIISPFGHAWFIHRSRFDACLERIVRDRGTIWIQSEAQKVDFGIESVQVKTSHESVNARFLIIANGSPSWAANVTCQQLTNIDSLTAFWALLPTTLGERLLSVEAADFGWWYICPGDNTGTFACCVTDASGARATRVAQVASWNDQFRATNICQQLVGVATARAINIISASTASLPLKHGQSWVAVGDAAMKLDPIGSSGTITALDSGRRAAGAVADALNGNVASIEKYELWSTNLVKAFTRQRVQHYAVEAQKRGDGFWSRRA